MTGVELIAYERAWQVRNWTPEHDDQHNQVELVTAAICYARAWAGDPVPPDWPFEASAWKPKGRIKNLVRAGALIAAEIDRLRRLPGVYA